VLTLGVSVLSASFVFGSSDSARSSIAEKELGRVKCITSPMFGNVGPASGGNVLIGDFVGLAVFGTVKAVGEFVGLAVGDFVGLNGSGGGQSFLQIE